MEGEAQQRDRGGVGGNNKLWSMAEVIILKRAFVPGVPSLRRYMHRGTNKDRCMGKYGKSEEEGGGIEYTCVTQCQETDRARKHCGKPGEIQYVCMSTREKTGKVMR